jgi:hypothetical protein
MSECAVVRRSAGPTPTKPTRRPGHLRACPSRSNLSGRPARHLVMRSAGIGWTRGPRIPGVRAAPSRREPSGWRPRPERSRTFRRALAEHSASCGPESALSSTRATRSPPAGGRRSVETESGSWRACPSTSARAHRRHLHRQLSELTGPDLMCFCEPDQPCHADTLLRLSAPTSPVIAR